MIGIKIKMPNCCDNCELNYDSIRCTVTGSEFYKESDPYETRLSNCPLVELPENCICNSLLKHPQCNTNIIKHE